MKIELKQSEYNTLLSILNNRREIIRDEIADINILITQVSRKSLKSLESDKTEMEQSLLETVNLVKKISRQKND